MMRMNVLVCREYANGKSDADPTLVTDAVFVVKHKKGREREKKIKSNIFYIYIRLTNESKRNGETALFIAVVCTHSHCVKI